MRLLYFVVYNSSESQGVGMIVGCAFDGEFGWFELFFDLGCDFLFAYCFFNYFYNSLTVSVVGGLFWCGSLGY